MNEKKIATPFELLHAVSLLSQQSRIGKFAAAINRAVRPGMSVADIGTGSGILALLAARSGASKVTAIDVNHESIEYARKAAKENGFEDIIECRTLHFMDFRPEERYDVAVCEMLSSFMLIEQQVPASHHIVTHVLKPGGVLLPQSATIYAVLAQCDSVSKRFECAGFSFSKLPQTVDSEEVEDLSELQTVANLRFSQLQDKNMVSKELTFKVLQDGTAHGIVGMFECTLVDNIVVEMKDGWRELLIPFEESIDVKQGDWLKVSIEYTPGSYTSLVIGVQKS
jgi:predicted RNA methylase